MENINMKHSEISIKLNKYFHHIDRGGTLKGEVMAGISVFFISICLIFINVQIISQTLGINYVYENSPLGPVNIENATSIAAIYAGSVIIAFIGSLVMGLIARLPLVQVSMMGLGSTMLGYMSINSGLTYYNFLFVSFIAAVIYVIIVSVPFIRDFAVNALPAPVKKALPAAFGLLIIIISLQLCGFSGITTLNVGQGTYSVFSIVKLSGESEIANAAFIVCIISIALFAVLRSLKIKHPVFWAFSGSTLVFIIWLLIIGGFNTTDPDSFINFGRLWPFVSSQASDSTPLGDSYFTYLFSGIGKVFSDFGNVFVKGTVFAEDVNAGSFIISGVVCYLLLGLSDTSCSLYTAADVDEINGAEKRDIQLAYICNAGVNVLAPLMGVCAVSGIPSNAGTKDNGKSGLTSVVAAIGFLTALFLWVYALLFATQTSYIASMNAYNYNAYGNGGFIYCFNGFGFGIANAVMLAIGAGMIIKITNINFKDLSETIPSVAVIICTVMSFNIAYGVAAGSIAYLIVKVFSFRQEGEDIIQSLKANFIKNILSINIPTVIVAVLSLLMIIFY